MTRLLNGFQSVLDKIESNRSDTVYINNKIRLQRKVKKMMFSLFRLIIFAGIAYIILGPLITIVTRSFFSNEDLYNPLVYLFPKNGTLGRYIHSFRRMDYINILGKTMVYDVALMVNQLFICSMTGYGFARYEFPLKRLLFGIVILTIVIPSHAIMLPLYQTFMDFNPFGLVGLVRGSGVNLLSSHIPMYIMTVFGVGLRSGLYIYIFNQFFRGLPKEFEEAAYIDGAGPWYTYFRIMLVNAMPSVITVSVFSLVWQYNDVFFPRLFVYGGDNAISMKIATLQSTISYVDKIMDPSEVQLYVYAGIVLTVLPLLLIYAVLQRYFMEGMERSGIVG